MLYSKAVSDLNAFEGRPVDYDNWNDKSLSLSSILKNLSTKLDELLEDMEPNTANVDANITRSINAALNAFSNRTLIDFNKNDNTSPRDKLTQLAQSAKGALDCLETARQQAGGIKSISELAEGVIADLSEKKAWLRGSDNVPERELALFTSIENLTGTEGDDGLSGDEKANMLDGAGGNDHIQARDGNDILKGKKGLFDGGLGEDSYLLSVEGEVTIQEDYSQGEGSHIQFLNKNITDISGISPDLANSAHLVMRFTDNTVVRLHNFYANQQATDNLAAVFYVKTRDGFSFSLKTAVTPPVADTLPGRILVRFDGTFTETEQQEAEVSLFARDKIVPAIVGITETVAGKRETRETVLPAFFDLVLDSPARGDVVGSSDRSDILTGRAGNLLEGAGGADTYLIENSEKGGVAVINNRNYTSPGMEQETDSIILPWDVEKTVLVVINQTEGQKTYRSLQLQHRSQPEQHVKVILWRFMEDKSYRNLRLQDAVSGQFYSLDVTNNGVVWLASGPLSMTTENRLEVLAVSAPGQILDGRTRVPPAEGEPQSTVIIDRSAQGNDLYGTLDTRNWLEVLAGNNRLYGGNQADSFYSGRGADEIKGGGGQDTLFLRPGFGHDRINGVERVFFAEEFDRSRLTFRRLGDDLDITLTGSADDSLLLENHYGQQDEKVKFLHFAGASPVELDAFEVQSGVKVSDLKNALVTLRDMDPPFDIFLPDGEPAYTIASDIEQIRLQIEVKEIALQLLEDSGQTMVHLTDDQNNQARLLLEHRDWNASPARLFTDAGEKWRLQVDLFHLKLNAAIEETQIQQDGNDLLLRPLSGTGAAIRLINFAGSQREPNWKLLFQGAVGEVEFRTVGLSSHLLVVNNLAPGSKDTFWLVNDTSELPPESRIYDGAGNDRLRWQGVRKEAVKLSREEEDLLIQVGEKILRWKGHYQSGVSMRLEHIVADDAVLSGDAIDALASAMAAIPVPAASGPFAGTAAEKTLAAAGQWQPWGVSAPVA